jgi:hypothetical protein
LRGSEKLPQLQLPTTNLPQSLRSTQDAAPVRKLLDFLLR